MKWAIENAQYLLGVSDEKGMRAGKYRWKDHGATRGEVGDGVHNYLEALHTGSWDYPELDEEQLAMIDQYEQLAAKHVIEPIYNEVTVGDTQSDAPWMGTFDVYGKFDGLLTLGDWKTSKKVYDTHLMQVAALAHAPEWFIKTGPMQWEVQPAPKIEQVAIVHLRSDSHALIPVENLDLHYKMYCAYAEVWHTLKALKKREEQF